MLYCSSELENWNCSFLLHLRTNLLIIFKKNYSGSFIIYIYIRGFCPRLRFKSQIFKNQNGSIAALIFFFKSFFGFIENWHPKGFRCRCLRIRRQKFKILKCAAQISSLNSIWRYKYLCKTKPS